MFLESNESEIAVSEEQKEPKAWCDESVAMLRKLWPDTIISAQGIANKINSKFGTSFSRSAILGKANRIGLPIRSNANQNFNRAAKRIAKGEARGVKYRPADPVNPDVFDGRIPLKQRRTLEQLTDETCKFMVGDPQDETSFFCGGPVFQRSFCEHHYMRCYFNPRVRKWSQRIAA